MEIFRECLKRVNSREIYNDFLNAEVFDIQHFEDIRNKYNVMSVPCLIINDEKVFFGKKNITQIVELISDI